MSDRLMRGIFLRLSEGVWSLAERRIHVPVSPPSGSCALTNASTAAADLKGVNGSGIKGDENVQAFPKTQSDEGLLGHQRFEGEVSGFYVDFVGESLVGDS